MIPHDSITFDNTFCFLFILKCKLACLIFRKVITIVTGMGLIFIYPKQVNTTKKSKMGMVLEKFS